MLTKVFKKIFGIFLCHMSSTHLLLVIKIGLLGPKDNLFYDRPLKSTKDEVYLAYSIYDDKLESDYGVSIYSTKNFKKNLQFLLVRALSLNPFFVVKKWYVWTKRQFILPLQKDNCFCYITYMVYMVIKAFQKKLLEF